MPQWTMTYSPMNDLILPSSAGRIRMPYDWKPRDYQMPAWAAMENGVRRMVLVWHRRAGKDLFCLNWMAKEMVEKPGLYWHLFPTYNQGRKIAWDGFTRTGRKFIDVFPPDLISSKNNQEMRMELKTGSIYQVVGSDNPDRLVGANPRGVVISEWSLCDPIVWQLIRPILTENGGWAIFVYTPRGKNHGWKMFNLAKKQFEKNPKRWFCQLLRVRDTLAIAQEDIDLDREEGMPEELIEQEYDCSFDAALVGSYYGPQMRSLEASGQIGKVPYDPRLPVDTDWDLGVNDAMTIWFSQRHGLEVRMIDYYESSGAGLDHYAKVLQDKKYVYGQHWAPHDIAVKEMGTGQTRLETAKSLGIKFRIARKLSITEGHQAVRNILPKCWFDAEKCERGINAMKEYQKKWDDKNKIYMDTPLHNWACHAADGFRTLAVRNKDNRDEYKQKQEYAVDNWQMGGSD